MVVLVFCSYKLHYHIVTFTFQVPSIPINLRNDWCYRILCSTDTDYICANLFFNFFMKPVFFLGEVPEPVLVVGDTGLSVEAWDL